MNQIQIFNDKRDDIFKEYRDKARRIFQEDRKHWYQASHDTEFYLEYLRRYCKFLPISDELMTAFRENADRIPAAETISRREREIRDEVRDEEEATHPSMENPENLSKFVLR